MLKQVKVTALCLFALIGAMTISCNKQQDPTVMEMSAKLDHNVNDDLVNTMAADQLVKDYVLDDVKFANDYTKWYMALTGSEQRARRAEVDLAIESGSQVSDPIHSASEIDAYNALQLDRATRIKMKYPQLSELSTEDYETVQNRVFSIVTENLGPQHLYAGGTGCIQGYRACLNYCRNGGVGTSAYARCVNGCSAGYYACIHASVPPKP